MAQNVIRRIDKEPTPSDILASIKNATNDRLYDIRAFIKNLMEIEGNYSILIDGEWGVGKTFFVHQIMAALLSLNQSQCKNSDLQPELESIREIIFPQLEGTKTYYPIYLNAWENDFNEDPILSIASCIIEALEENYDLTKQGQSAGKALIDFISSFKLSFSVPTPFPGMQANLEVDPEKAAKAIRKTDILDQYKAKKKFRHDLAQALDSSTEGRADRFVLFVDELDRCRPEFAVRVLESLRFLFNQNVLTIVLSANARALGDSISSWYGRGFDGQRYLMRFYDELKQLTSFDVALYLRSLGITVGWDEPVVRCISSHRLTMRDVNRCSNTLKNIFQETIKQPGNSYTRLFLSYFACEIACLIGSKGPSVQNQVLSGQGVDLVQEWLSESEMLQFASSTIANTDTLDEMPGISINSKGQKVADMTEMITSMYDVFFSYADDDPRLNSATWALNAARSVIRPLFSLSKERI